MPDYVYCDARSIYPDERTSGAVKRSHLRMDVEVSCLSGVGSTSMHEYLLQCTRGCRPESRHLRDETTGEVSAQVSILPRCTSVYLSARMVGALGRFGFKAELAAREMT